MWVRCVVRVADCRHQCDSLLSNDKVVLRQLSPSAERNAQRKKCCAGQTSGQTPLDAAATDRELICRPQGQIDNLAYWQEPTWPPELRARGVKLEVRAATKLATCRRPHCRRARRRASDGAAAASPARTATLVRSSTSQTPFSRSEATRSVTLPTLVEPLPRPTARQPRRPSPSTGVLEERVGTVRKALSAVGTHGLGGCGQGRPVRRLV